MVEMISLLFVILATYVPDILIGEHIPAAAYKSLVLRGSK